MKKNVKRNYLPQLKAVHCLMLHFVGLKYLPKAEVQYPELGLREAFQSPLHNIISLKWRRFPT